MLGPLEFGDGTRWSGVGAAKWRSLLAVLLINAGRVLTIDRLVAELWGDDPPATAPNLVHGYVARLRGLLDDRGGRLLVTRSPGYMLLAGPADVDTGRFAELTDAGRLALAANDPMRAAELLAEALAIWRGPALADVPVTPLVEAEAARLGELRLEALETRLEAELALGRYAEAIPELRALTRDHPLREQLWLRLIAALHGAGRRAEALSVYAQARAMLAAELGIEPGPALRRIHQTVLNGAESDPPHRVPDQLPAEPAVLVGRDAALARAGRWLAGRSPWIAVTGPAGVGKTAFVLGLAHRARPLYGDGILVAEMAPVACLLARFLAALGIPVDPGELGAEPARTFSDLLGGRRVLIVLDGVRDEAEVRPLFPVPPGCGLVLTSRRRLAGLTGVRALPLDVLPVEAGVTLLRLVAGDRRVGRDPGPAPEVVRLCGGLPLAIKIAGARLAARPQWTVGDLARRLADARDRLDWLRLGDLDVRATLEETVSGLTTDQQRLLRRLGLLDLPEFEGWVAAALLDTDSGRADQLLDDLVEEHLVEPTGPRYRMHDLVRLVAGEVAADGDRAALDRVYDGWLALASAADDELAHWAGLDPQPPVRWRPDPGLLAAASADPMGWFDDELDALVRAIHRGPGVAWALAQRMATYLELRGRYDLWRDVLGRGLHAADRAGDRQGQATMLGLLMEVEAGRDEHAASLRYAALALAAYRELSADPMPGPAGPAPVTATLTAARRSGDALAVGFEAARLALATRLAGQHADYLSLFEEARDAFRAGAAPLLELWALKTVGLVYCRQRRFADAEVCLRRAQAILRELGPRSATWFAGGDLAGVAAAHGRVDLAERLAGEALAHARRTGDRWSQGRALVTLAGVRAALGEPDAAGAVYREALAVWQDLRMPRRVAQVRAELDRLAGPAPPKSGEDGAGHGAQPQCSNGLV